MSGELLTLNGSGVVFARIRMPRTGLWNADVKVDSSTVVTGGVTIATPDGSFSLKGTVVRAGIFDSTLSMRIVAGAGGFNKPLTAKSYQNVPVSVILKEILTGVGETLSPTSDPAVTSSMLAKWTRAADTAGRSLYRLLYNYATSFRVLNDGTTWIGTDTFPNVPNVDFALTERWFGEGRVVVKSQQPFILPGTTLALPGFTGAPQKVSAVVHAIDKSNCKAEVYFEG